MKARIALALILLAGPVWAQSDVLMMFGKDTTFFNWPAIEKCAVETYDAPSPNASMLSREWKEYEYNYNRITSCRLALLARHEGWKAAGGKEPDLYPPQPYLNSGDFVARRHVGDKPLGNPN